MDLSTSTEVHRLTSISHIDLTSEEIREKRRKERQQFKIDRARALAEAAAEAEAAFAEGRQANVIAIPSGATWKPHTSSESTLPSATSLPEIPDEELEEEEPKEEEPIVDVEHLQLTLQEAFFLIWNLDCLTILDPATVRAPTRRLAIMLILSIE